MISQNILNFLVYTIKELLSLIPDVPVEMEGLLQSVQDGATFIASKVGLFGVIVPFETFGGLLVIWVSLLGFWVAMQAARLVFMVFGR